MSSPVSSVRRIVFGLTLAAAVALGSDLLLALAPCEESTPCAVGTALYPNTIGCGCLGNGSCSVVSVGHQVQCACDEFPVTNCDCENGCQ